MQIVLFALLTFIVAAAPAAGSITRIAIEPAQSQSPVFDGRVFGPGGGVGPYEKLRGKAYGELDPDDPRNAVITDLKLAPRNARGRVEYLDGHLHPEAGGPAQGQPQNVPGLQQSR